MVLVEQWDVMTHRVGNEKSRLLPGWHASLDIQPFLCRGADILLDKVGQAFILRP